MVIVVASIMNFFSIIVSSVPFMILEFQLLNLLIMELMSGEGTPSLWCVFFFLGSA